MFGKFISGVSLVIKAFRSNFNFHHYIHNNFGGSVGGTLGGYKTETCNFANARNVQFYTCCIHLREYPYNLNSENLLYVYICAHPHTREAKSFCGISPTLNQFVSC